MAHCCCLVDDLIFATRIQRTAEALGAALTVARCASQLQEQLRDDTRMVIVDLQLEGQDPVMLIRRLRSANSPLQIVAYVPHICKDLAESARQAGADMVLTRSEFTARLSELLSTF